MAPACMAFPSVCVIDVMLVMAACVPHGRTRCRNALSLGTHSTLALRSCCSWDKENFPWSRELRELNQTQFGNKGFRHQQLQIINATLSQRDVFVLMPTGATELKGRHVCLNHAMRVCGCPWKSNTRVLKLAKAARLSQWLIRTGTMISLSGCMSYRKDHWGDC